MTRRDGFRTADLAEHVDRDTERGDTLTISTYLTMQAQSAIESAAVPPASSVWKRWERACRAERLQRALLPIRLVEYGGVGVAATIAAAIGGIWTPLPIGRSFRMGPLDVGTLLQPEPAVAAAIGVLVFVFLAVSPLYSKWSAS